MLLFILSLILLSILIFTSLFTYYTKNVEHLSIYHSPFEISNIQNLELYNDQTDYTPFVNYKNYPILQEDDPNFSEVDKFPLIKSIEYSGKQSTISFIIKDDAYTGNSNPMTTTMTTRSNIKSPVTTNSNTPPSMAASANTPPSMAASANTPPSMAASANTPPSMAASANTPPSMVASANTSPAMAASANTPPAMAGSSNITGAIPVTASTIPSTTYTIVPPMTTSF